MPYDIIRNGPGCKGGYAVVGPSGAHGCHKTRGSAVQQQRALYAAEADSKKVTKAEEWEGKPLYDQLSDAEQMLADSLLKLAQEAGPLDKAEGIWVGYEDGVTNENASIGVKCGNCALHKSSVACAILDMPIEEEGACRFAVIPDGYVTVGSDVQDDMDNPNHEDDMSKRSIEDLDLEWFYPYNYPPTCRDISNYLKVNEISKIQNQDSEIKIQKSRFKDRDSKIKIQRLRSRS